MLFLIKNRCLDRLSQRLTWLACFCCTTAFGIDFSGPLQNVQVSANNMGLVSYSVTDPVFGPRSGVANTPGNFVSTPVNSGGVVAWVASGTSGSTIYYLIYDPGRSNWVANSASTTATSIIGPINDSGIVAWQANGVVSFVVYDPISGAWNLASLQQNNYTNLKNSGGIVACLLSQTAYFVTFNPVTRNWVLGNLTKAGFIPDIQANSGVVAWQAGNGVFFSTYDFSRASWISASGGGAGVINNLTIANSTVTWSSGTPSQNFTAGYNSAGGVWTASSTPVRPSFLVAPASGNPPLFVWFTDLSLGGTSWSWNFGDGATATGRTPYHVFNGLGRYSVVETVAGTTGMSTASTNILTDLLPPSGGIVVNNDDSYTRSTNVTLTMSVTDNSGTVSAMRFSNTNGTNWSLWIPYASTTPWILSAGDGLKSVYAEFTDPASNILVVSDSITLDSRPPPVAYITNYFVKESTPILQVAVQLANSTPFQVSVDYATSDGTATAGSDYASASGRIIFQPTETLKTFNLFITNDTLVELNETIFVTLSNPTNATVAPPATVTILDDDPPTVSFATNNFRIDETAGAATVTVTLNAPSGLTPTINYATSNGTATAGIDYTAVSGTLTFTPGQTSATFQVPIINETTNEPSETVLLYLSHPTNALLGAQSSATLTILDDNPPRASFDTNVFLVNEAAGSAAITVRLSNPFIQAVGIDYATSDGTAKVGTDYVQANGSLTFFPGQTSKSFDITILNNPLRTSNVTVHLSLPPGGMVNATPGLFITGTLTIFKDGPPRLGSLSWRTNSGFHFTLSGPVGRNYAIEASTNLLSSNSLQWLEISRLTNTTGTVEFTDPPSSGLKKRFYRARQTN